MYKLGYSVYLSNFQNIKDKLPSFCNDGSYVFTSMHVSEEADENYKAEMRKMMNFLKVAGFKVICDVSRHSLEIASFNNLKELKDYFGIDILRIDYGYSIDEINELLRDMPICLNASTVKREQLEKIDPSAFKPIFLHNFYPHRDTGLDPETYVQKNEMIQSFGYQTMTFISGDNNFRAPMHEGLPTLETHRFRTPFYQALDLYLNFNAEMIFVGDSLLTEAEDNKIKRFINEGVIELEAILDEEYDYLYNQVFTIRTDSPKYLKRLQESREYSRQGKLIEPFNTVERTRGSVSIDNKLYKRYSSEVMIYLDDYPQDDRVNVIGSLTDIELCDIIENDVRIELVRK